MFIFSNMFSIGKLEIRTRVLPAPLAGYSDRALRDLLREFGCHLIFTEMVSAEGIIRSQRQTWNLLDMEEEPPPVGVQIFGSNPSSMAEAARMVQDTGAALIDVNMGCPVKKVVRNGAGSALLDNPGKALEIVRSMKKAVSIPLTVKMRTGSELNPDAALKLGPIFESEGVDALCLHGRTREQVFHGKADWEPIGALKSLVKIPVIGNGDIQEGEDARRMMQKTGCDAVMIGRGGLGNPWLYPQCHAALGEISLSDSLEPTVPDRIRTAIHHLEMMVSRMPEKTAVKKFRKHAMCYLKGCPFARQMRAQYFEKVTYKEAKEFLTETIQN